MASAEGTWSIGPIIGQYQPEDFTETQSVDYQVPPTFGTVPPLIFRKWNPREVTLSFVVNSICIPVEEEAINPEIKNAIVQSDPEVVWATICSMMRRQRKNPGFPMILGEQFPRVTIPGWGIGGFGPSRAVVTDASFKRTHIAGRPSRCVRGIITVRLKEFRLIGQRGFSEREAGIAVNKKKESIPGGLGVVFNR